MHLHCYLVEIKIFAVTGDVKARPIGASTISAMNHFPLLLLKCNLTCRSMPLRLSGKSVVCARAYVREFLPTVSGYVGLGMVCRNIVKNWGRGIYSIIAV